MNLIELPHSISNPSLLCPNFERNTEEKVEENVMNHENSHQIKKNKLMNALFMTEEQDNPEVISKNQSEEKQLQKQTSVNEWETLQCSAVYPMWDYRKNIKSELGLTKSSIENEIKISDCIMSRFCQHLTAMKCPPEIIFHVSVHIVQESGDENYVCVHLKNVQSRKKVGGRILGFLCDFLPKMLKNDEKD